MNKKSEQDTQNGVIKRPMEWNIKVSDKKHHRKGECHGLDALEENDQLENFVYWDINSAHLFVSHPTKFTILSKGNGTPMPISINKFPDDFEPSKTVISEDISSDVAAIGNETTVLFGPTPTELRTKEDLFSQSQHHGLTASGEKAIDTGCTKRDVIPEKIALQISTGLPNGAECRAPANPDETAGLQVHTVELCIVPNTRDHKELPPLPILSSDNDCSTRAMKSKYEEAGIKAINRTIRSKGCSNCMIERLFANLASMVAKGELRITLQSSINIAQYKNDANRLTQNEGRTFFVVSRITDKHPNLSSSIVNGSNAPKITALTPDNLYDGTEANNLAANRCLLRFKSTDDHVKNQPWYNYTNLTSDHTVIGNDTEILLPYESNTGRSMDWSSNQAGNVDERASMAASNLLLQVPQYTKCLVLNQLSKAYPDVLNTMGAIAKPKHTSIINYCQDLRNSGEFQKHQRVLDYYRQEVCQQDPDLLVSFNLEEALALINKSNVTAANKSLETLKAITVKAENSSLLLGRIYVFVANIELRKKDYKEAIKILDIAASYLDYFASGDEKTFLCYIYGVAYMMLAGECQSPDEELEKQALQYFDLYLQHAKIHNGCGYFVRRGINYVMFQKASIYLRTYNNILRDCQVSTRAVEMAKECLKVVEDATEFAKEHATEIKIISIKSDIAYREEEFGRAKSILMEGIALSKDEAFTPFIVKEALEERLTFLKKLQ